MRAQELFSHLASYLAQAPSNKDAEVIMKQAEGGYCFAIGGANDARGVVPGQHALILLPAGPPIGVKEFSGSVQ